MMMIIYIIILSLLSLISCKRTTSFSIRSSLSSTSLSSSSSPVWEHYYNTIDGFGADHIVEEVNDSKGSNRGRRISSMCKVAGTYGEIKAEGISLLLLSHHNYY